MSWISRLNYVLIRSLLTLFSCFSFAKAVSTSNEAVIPPVSVQLWSVRDKLGEDFEGTLVELSKMGFSGVEFAGNYGNYENQPEKLKALLESLNLKVSGVHVSFKDLNEKNLQKNLKFFQKLGVKFVIVPWDERAWSSDGVQSLVADLNALVKPLAAYNMKIGFHNHHKEFNSYQSSTFWDYIATNSQSDVLLQLDVGWVIYADKSPIKYVKRYPGRTLSTHYKIRTHKENQQSPIIGNNDYSWDKLIKANIEFGGTEWIVLEQEEYPENMNSLEAVQLSFEGLNRAIKKITQSKR